MRELKRATTVTDAGHEPLETAQPPFSSGTPQALLLQDPNSLLQTMLFLWEFCEGGSTSPEGREPLRFFFRRAGGVHLLLMLLNAHYNKSRAGRRPGWQFCVLHDRLRISTRTLRMLIQDAQQEGLVDQLPGIRDKRTRTYILADPVIEAWERLTSDLVVSMSDVFGSCGPNELANADYREWDPKRPAPEQISRTRPFKWAHRP